MQQYNEEKVDGKQEGIDASAKDEESTQECDKLV